MFILDNIIRKNIKDLVPYSSARDEFDGSAAIFLDANENTVGSPLPVCKGMDIPFNRYPDPYQSDLKEAISRLKKLDTEQIFCGNGSDECIDLLYRCFCEPGEDNVIVCPPTYGMYDVSANVNNIETRKAALRADYQIDLPAIEKLIDRNTKLLWLCSPNNPTGNCINRSDIVYLLRHFHGIVVVDEAYIDFARETSMTSILEEFPNLVVLQTFSKAWGLAGLRLGMAFGSPEFIHILNKVKPPYNINSVTQQYALNAMNNKTVVDDHITTIIQNRNKLYTALEQLPFTIKVFDSEANFLLARMKDATLVYEHLLKKGIVVRNRSKILLCDDCLRITVGNENEICALIASLKTYPS